MGILYSMCWEDPEVLLEALNISKKDKVLSICSGGENIFAMLLKDPKKIVAIDINKEQIYLTKLKAVAIKNLRFDEFIQFLGFKRCKDRGALFEKLKRSLDEEDLIYWTSHLDKIKLGVIHCGKLERYLEKFRKFLLPLILSKKNIENFLKLETLKEQEKFFDRKWDNWRFRLLFRLFFSEKGMSYGRKKEYFKCSEKNKISSHYLERTRYGLTMISIKSNFFMQYILTGKILEGFENHPYLDRENFNKLKKIINKIEFVDMNFQDYIKKIKINSFTKFNLSDIFELKTQQEYENILKEIVEISGKNGIVCYWNNLVPRYEHKKINGIKKNESFSKLLSSRDRCHFYSRFIVEKIKTK